MLRWSPSSFMLVLRFAHSKMFVLMIASEILSENCFWFCLSSQVVGWPPIGSHRMSSLVNNQAMKAARAEEEGEEEGKKKAEPKDLSMKVNGKVQGLGFVKVNMDGVGIGRKVDMRGHSSYENLAQTLEGMFFGMTGYHSCQLLQN